MFEAGWPPPPLSAASLEPTEADTDSKWDEASSSSSSKSNRPIRWVPSKREVRKYASLFLRTDADGDGLVHAREARAVVERSGLDDGTLALAWSYADRDRDGCLTFREFVSLVHSVSCAREGLQLPPPRDLEVAVAAIVQTPQELERQRRSRSSSRSGTDWAGGGHSEDDEIPSRPGFPRFGGEQREERRTALDAKRIATHLRALLRADRAAVSRARKEAEELGELVDSAQEGAREKRPLLLREREETVRLAELLRQLRAQLAAARARLAVVQSQKRGLACGLEGVVRERLRGEEAKDTLQQALEEEVRVVEEMERANTQLEQSCRSLAEDLASMERERHQVLQDLAREEQEHRTDERELLGMRRDNTSTVQTRRPEFSISAGADAEAHSWASSLVGGGIAPWTNVDAQRRSGV